jgi:hypothetical protein
MQYRAIPPSALSSIDQACRSNTIEYIIQASDVGHTIRG